MKNFGLIGYPLTHSFSKSFFQKNLMKKERRIFTTIIMKLKILMILI